MASLQLGLLLHELRVRLEELHVVVLQLRLPAGQRGGIKACAILPNVVTMFQIVEKYLTRRTAGILPNCLT